MRALGVVGGLLGSLVGVRLRRLGRAESRLLGLAGALLLGRILGDRQRFRRIGRELRRLDADGLLLLGGGGLRPGSGCVGVRLRRRRVGRFLGCRLVLDRLEHRRAGVRGHRDLDPAGLVLVALRIEVGDRLRHAVLAELDLPVVVAQQRAPDELEELLRVVGVRREGGLRQSAVVVGAEAHDVTGATAVGEEPVDRVSEVGVLEIRTVLGARRGIPEHARELEPARDARRLVGRACGCEADERCGRRPHALDRLDAPGDLVDVDAGVLVGRHVAPSRLGSDRSRNSRRTASRSAAHGHPLRQDALPVRPRTTAPKGAAAAPAGRAPSWSRRPPRRRRRGPARRARRPAPRRRRSAPPRRRSSTGRPSATRPRRRARHGPRRR